MTQLTPNLRKRVMRAYGWKCYRCGKGINSLTGQIHHRDGDWQNNSLSNLRPVCKQCHKELTTAQMKRRAREEQIW